MPKLDLSHRTSALPSTIWNQLGDLEPRTDAERAMAREIYAEVKDIAYTLLAVRAAIRTMRGPTIETL